MGRFASFRQSDRSIACSRASALVQVAALTLAACTPLDQTPLAPDSGAGDGSVSATGASDAAGGPADGGTAARRTPHAQAETADATADAWQPSSAHAGSPGPSGDAGGWDAEAMVEPPMLRCPKKQRACAGECIDADACCDDSECGEGRTCVKRACECKPGTRACSDACVPLTQCCSDADCLEDGRCQTGECTCPEGTHRCGDRCASDSAVETCGSACEPCEAPAGGGVDCVGGQCVPKCPSGQVACLSACIPASMACSGVCRAGTHDCAGVCLANDSVNACGTSCTPCPAPEGPGMASCDGMKCGVRCAPGHELCGSKCIPVESCCTAAECPRGASCSGSGVCECPAGQKPCGDACIPMTGCCTTADCPSGSMCSEANACACDANHKACGTACILPDECCGDGDCQPSQRCVSRKCECVPDCSDKACGPNGCGGMCPDTCSGNTRCNAATSQCECVPDCTNKPCGSDGCGGMCPDSCLAGTTCNAGANRCDCTPNCTNKACGPNGCGGMCPDTCAGNTRCNAATSQCECVPDCTNKPCGSDGCTGTCPNTCAPGTMCNASANRCDCAPQCSGRVCGPDGCGGRCEPDDCAADASCIDGRCVAQCGNGVVDSGEDCDDGNTVESDDCIACRTASCGDRFVHEGIEECDPAAAGWSGRCHDGCERVAYQRCADESECLGAPSEARCAALVPNARQQFCSNYAMDVGTCPTVPGFTAVLNFGSCMLLCNDGDCPSLMVCVPDVQRLDLAGIPIELIDVCAPAP